MKIKINSKRKSKVTFTIKSHIKIKIKNKINKIVIN